MRKNKLFSILAAVACALACCFGVACAKKNPQEQNKDEYQITLNRETLEMVERDSYDLKATLLKNGEAASGEIVWASSDEGIATVANGAVTAIKEGKATITALWQEQLAKCEIVVAKYYDPEWAVSISDNALSLYKTAAGAESVTLTVTASFGGETLESGYTVKWSSDNESVATVNEKGAVTAVATGTATITLEAKYESFIAYATCAVTVAEPKINLLDTAMYEYEIDDATNVAKIPVDEKYGEVVSITDENGEAVKFRAEDGCVLPDFSLSVRKGKITILMETATHTITTSVYVADGFIETAEELLSATQRMDDGKLFVLNADIDMSTYAWTLTETEVRVNYVAQMLQTRKLFTFKGEFDGNGHKLYNISETDKEKYLEIFSFAPNSYVYGLEIVVSDIKMFSKEAVNYLFGEIGAGATVENCTFDINVTQRMSWQDELFSAINGSFKNCTVTFRDKAPMCVLSHLLKGEASNITFIGMETGLSKIRLCGTNGTNYSQMTGSVSDLYFYATETDYENGVGTYFYGRGVVKYNAQEYTFADWWGNKVDLNGDETVDSLDKTWDVVITESLATANE